MNVLTWIDRSVDYGKFCGNIFKGKGYNVNSKAQAVIKECDNWYANRVIEDFHERTTVHGTPYQLNRMGFAKDAARTMQIYAK